MDPPGYHPEITEQVQHLHDLLDGIDEANHPGNQPQLYNATSKAFAAFHVLLYHTYKLDPTKWGK